MNICSNFSIVYLAISGLLRSEEVLGLFDFSEVELGEHDIEADPDCKNCAKRITMKITDPKKQIITHKGFDQSGQNDIALIRFNEPIPLFR